MLPKYSRCGIRNETARVTPCVRDHLFNYRFLWDSACVTSIPSKNSFLVYKDVPDPIGKVEVEWMEIMNFGDGVYMMAFESHGKEGGFKDGTKYAGVRNGIERYYIQRWSERRSKDAGLHRHSRIMRKKWVRVVVEKSREVACLYILTNYFWREYWWRRQNSIEIGKDRKSVV